MQDTNLNWLILAMIQMRVLRMWTRLSMIERVLPFNLVILIDMSVLVGLITNYTIIIIMSFCVCVSLLPWDKVNQPMRSGSHGNDEHVCPATPLLSGSTSSTLVCIVMTQILKRRHAVRLSQNPQQRFRAGFPNWVPRSEQGWARDLHD